MRLYVGFTAFQTHVDPADVGRFAVVETHPVVDFETLGKFFAEHSPS
ncbi:MAG TPA: hypothetical protein VH081_12125 [Solirubrobacteraceae bacterium]|nr:hypothetical protein [Solirubrobacteraceae bacterium]